jgi:hypothetical protein
MTTTAAPNGESKIVLVVWPTRLDDLVVRHNTIQQAQFYVEHMGGGLVADFSDYLAEHRRYHEAVRQTESVLREFGRVQILPRRYLANFIFGPGDTVVGLGQDGLVANTLRRQDRDDGEGDAQRRADPSRRERSVHRPAHPCVRALPHRDRGPGRAALVEWSHRLYRPRLHRLAPQRLRRLGGGGRTGVEAQGARVRQTRARQTRVRE